MLDDRKLEIVAGLLDAIGYKYRMLRAFVEISAPRTIIENQIKLLRLSVDALAAVMRSEGEN